MQIQVHQPTDAELRALGVFAWPIWTCDASTFDWTYDQKETCYLLAGRAMVKAGDQSVSFGKGDLVVFPSGLSCVWQVIEPVRKHYRFG